MSWLSESWLGEVWRRLRFRSRGARFDEDLAEEMRLHMDLRAAEKQARGMAEGDAEVAARRQFGNVTQMRERSREAWGWTFLDTLQQDIRYGARTLAAQRGFTATAVLSLALGVGANTAIFSILNAVILRSLPVEDPQKLVQIRTGGAGAFTNRNGGEGSFTNPIWEQIRDHQQAFSGTLAYSSDRFDLAEGGESQYARGMWVSGDFFRVLGVPALKGRVFTFEDDRRGAAALAVISHDFWERHFQGDSGVIGKTVRLNRQPFEIVGVTPPWFTGLDVDQRYEVAIPIGCDPLLRTDRSSLDNRSWWWLNVLGRLAPGTSIEQAEDRMRALAPEIYKATLPQNWEPDGQQHYLSRTFGLRPAATGFSATGTRYATALFTLMAIVGLVLLIACANIANLLLARAAARQREFSMRMAIGASRRRVIRQLLTESVLLSMLGTAAGFVLAAWGGRLLVRLLSTAGRPLQIDLSPDIRVFAFTVGVALLTALLFGLAPAFRATRLGLNQVLKESSRSAVRGSTRFHAGKALVTAQVALSLVLLVGAGLFLGTLRNLLRVDLGFSPQNILLMRANLERTTIPRGERARASLEILERLRSLPGVSSAAASLAFAPVGGSVWNGWTYPEGSSRKSWEDVHVYFNRVSPGYFETMKTPLLLGRDFNAADDLNSPPVIIIGEKTARDFFGSESAIGKMIGLDGDSPTALKVLHQVIGVVKDVKYRVIQEETLRTAYLTTAQDKEPWGSIGYAIRANGTADALIPSLREAIKEVNPDISLEFRGFETQIRESLLQPRLVALLSSIFGLLALLLSMVGLYGITAYGVTRRQGEIGIRIALGAQRRSVVWLILRDVVLLLAIGMSLGLAASLAAGRLVASLLYGLEFNEPAHLAAAMATLAAATAIAAYLPARRAARLDPMAALREE